METALSSDEVLVCQTCGDKGYANAFVYCVKCLEFVIHRYCLDVVPETPDELVIWRCDDCNPPLPYHFSLSQKHELSQSQKEDPPNSAPLKTTHPKKKQKNISLKERIIASLVASGEGNERVSPPKRLDRCVVLGLERPKDKSLQLQETVATSLQKSNCQKSVEAPTNSLPKEALVSSDSGANQVTPPSAELENACSPLKASVKRKRDTIRVAKRMKHNSDKSTDHSSCESSCTDATLKNEEDVTNTEEGLKCGPDHEKFVSNSSSTDKELTKMSKEFNGSSFASQSTYLENDKQYIHDEPARPVLDPVWRGSFKILQTDYDILEGFVGHLSGKVCARVCKEATELPSMLSLEMDSRAHIWPKSFLDSMPSDEHIALYFFPGDTEIERDFVRLVNNMIDEDLAMKATAKNAELLIFTSKVLPQSYWRFQGNYYLWGVFKKKQNDVPVSNQSDNHGLPANSGSEVTREKDILKRVKTIESHSPQSPLCKYR